MGAPDTCREAVLLAFAALERRHGREVFRLEEIADEVTATWAQWERTTVTTHVSSHMCREAPIHYWPDLERVDRGRYRKLFNTLRSTSNPDNIQHAAVVEPAVVETGHEFERRARSVLSELWSVELLPATVTFSGGVEKVFDLVSPDQSIVGDAKRYTSLKTPAAKWSTIAEYVWLLQKLPAGTRTFLVFGGDIDVPQRWLDRFRALAEPVAFYYLKDDRLAQL